MRRIVVHIGLERTGSSAIQRFMAMNRVALRVMGVRYPRQLHPDETPRDKHYDLAAALLGDGSRAAGADLDAAETVFEHYLAEAGRHRLTVLSDEKLGSPAPHVAARLAPRVGNRDTRIVVYLRRQDEWALSAYRAAVTDPRKTESRPLADWLADPATRARMDYAAILAPWEDAFGSGALRVMRYPHDIPLISGFLRAIQAPPAAMMLPGRDLRVNESLADNALLAALEGRGLPPELPDLDQPARDRLIDSFADSNEAVRARYFPENRTLFGLD